MIEHMFDLTSLGEAARKVADLDPALADGEALMVDVLELESSIRALEAARAAWLGELERRGTTDEVTGHRSAAWFAVESNCPRAGARRLVRTGRHLAGGLGEVAAALAEGAVSSEHAQVLADLADGAAGDVVVGCQAELLGLAQVLPFERWRQEVRGLVSLADPDGGFRPGPEGSTLRLATGFGGSLELTGTVVGDGGQVLRDALGAAADRLSLRYRREVKAGVRDAVPSRSELLAEALVNLVRQGLVAGRDGRSPVTELTLVAHAHDPLGVRPHDGAPSSTGMSVDATSDPATVASPVQSLRDLSGGAGVGATDRCRDASMSDATARTLCCDPVLRTVVLDSLGNPLDLGRRTRLVPPGLRRAVEVRDGGCIFPGCDAPATWCDLHHVVHWADGGATSAENLASLCRHHHGVTHRRGWTMGPDPARPQRFRWERPDGTVVRSQRHGARE